MADYADYVIIVVHFAALFIAALIYMRILAIKAVRVWQKTYNRTWVLVIIGAVLILADIRSLIAWGIGDLFTWALIVIGCCVCGGPIAYGEKIQDAKENGKIEAADRYTTKESDT